MASKRRLRTGDFCICKDEAGDHTNVQESGLRSTANTGVAISAGI
jgi:hypothetical protein